MAGSYPGSSGGVMGTQTPGWVMGTVTGNKSYIAQIQNVLNKLGYNVGAADGVIGNRTLAGIRSFQQKAGGLSVNGLLTAATKKKLYDAYQNYNTTRTGNPRANIPGRSNTRPSGGTPVDTGLGLGSDYSGLGSVTSNVPMGVTPTIDVYKRRTLEEIIKEATQTATSTYDPLIKGMLERLANQQGQLSSGRLDIQKNYAQQNADLAEIMLRSKAGNEANRAATGQLYERGKEQLEANTQAGLAGGTANYQASQNMLNALLGGSGAAPVSGSAGQAALARDYGLGQNLLQAVGQINQGAMTMQQGMNQNLSDIMSAGVESQQGLQQGQNMLARDKALRDIDTQIGARVDEIMSELHTTESEKQAKLYELIKSLQETDWQRYMDSAGANFNQNLASAQLGQSGAELQLEEASLIQKALQDAAGGSGSGSEQTTAYAIGLNLLNNSTANLSPETKTKMQEIFNIIYNPTITTGAPITNELGTAQPGNYYGPVNKGEIARIQDYKVRAYNMMKNRHLATSVQDPNWLVMSNAIDAMFGLTKGT